MAPDEATWATLKTDAMVLAALKLSKLAGFLQNVGAERAARWVSDRAVSLVGPPPEPPFVPIPAPTAEVRVHGPDSWTVEVGWIDPIDDKPWPLIGIIYDGEMDPRHPHYEAVSVPGLGAPKPDPKLVFWDEMGDVIGDTDIALDSMPGVTELFARLTTTNPRSTP